MFPALILVVVGYFIGVKLVLLAQLAIIVAGIAYLNSPRMCGTGMEGLFHIAALLCLIMGMAIGDVVYLIAHGVPPSVRDALTWLVSV